MAEKDKGTLYMVATPIGNLEDMTYRGVRILNEVDLIGAEDTRRARKLASRYGITTPVTSYHEHNEFDKGGTLIEALCSGQDVAIISDAGTPAISDPGFRLIEAASNVGIRVVPVPGPSSVTALMSVAPLGGDSFTFKGFLPHETAKRKRLFLDISRESGTYVFFESPNRVLSTLRYLQEVLGDVAVSIGRELTKIHEEVLRGSVATMIEHFSEVPPRGEFVIAVGIEKGGKAGRGDEDMDSYIGALLKSNLPVKEVAKGVASEYGLSSSDAYKEVLRVKGSA